VEVLVQKALVLGAGYMGSAITFPLSDNGIEVNLWGTWLDDNLIESSIKGFHPKLKKPLPGNVKLFYWQDITTALEDIEIIFIGIASEGFVKVFKLLLDNLTPGRNYCFFKLTKGFVEYEGKILRATEAALEMYNRKIKDKKFSDSGKILWASVGGPVRAIDLASRTPSATVYGLSDIKMENILKSFSTDYYRIFPSDDIEGVEICSTFKNVYAMAAGICDGIFKKENEGTYYNIVAFLFNQAVQEIARIVEITGKNSRIVFDLAGIGDLHVTSAAGRNRRYGELVGSGVDGKTAFKKMYDEGEFGEGYVALKLSIPWLSNRYKITKNYIKEKLPLLDTLDRIIFKKENAMQSIKMLVRRLGQR
jgi:glycerol-3-phosphate dehydrogenase (NAD(P)+)